MVGVVFFLNWTVTTEPVVSRWQTSVRNQTNLYAATITQIFSTQGEAGVREFLGRIRNVETVTEVNLVGRDGRLWRLDLFACRQREGKHAHHERREDQTFHCHGL